MRWVAVSSLVAGIAGYVVIFLATSTLGASRFEIFNVYWGLFFTLQGIIQGLMHETTRGVRSALTRGGDDEADDPTADDLLTERVGADETVVPPDERVRPLRVGIAMGSIAAGLVLASSPLWARAVLSSDHLVLGVGLLTAATWLAAAIVSSSRSRASRPA